jgi:hypothetical protein
MSWLKSALLLGLVTVGVSACASTSKPAAGTIRSSGHSAAGLLDVHGKVDDPRLKHYVCLRADHLPVTEPGPTQIQVGAPGVGPLINFLATPGMAQSAQIANRDGGAEVIGSALLFPNQASDGELQTIEACAALGVKG